ncbi:hypothetical protein BTO10_05305 [Vibrio chagasii]|uniref:HTH tetR-type domain-containing protein n=1 Tax=Vibrio chagasii TaxID=170679 RepID=A0A2S7VPX9_9VIBR|nr:TetR/AcrR family transcriptional regulator [Vibrio chagasii]PQJ64206.1 hypothetical protein BTO10_05305 [Vibrio chagasii]
MKPSEAVKRKKILQSAIAHFSKTSYRNVKVNAIANSAGVSPSLIYYYYESKEHLFVESYAHIINQRVKSVSKLTFKKLVLLYTSVFLENYKFSASISEVASSNRDAKHDIHEVVYSCFKLCSDIKLTDYDTYLAVLMGLIPSQEVMSCPKEANFKMHNLLEAYNKLLK